jgi:hypothetical protein
MPRPSDTTYESLASGLEAALDAAAVARPQPGAPWLHRLNRSEYTNAVRDLLALDIDAASLLPADDAAAGFDNNAGLLGVSPTLLERYLSAAAKISALAVGDATLLVQPRRPMSCVVMYPRTRTSMACRLARVAAWPHTIRFH